MNTVENRTMDEERALYGSKNLLVKNCRFDGPADGESALKESRNITVEDTFCNLRYPFWHDTNLTLKNCNLTPLCRAAVWYSGNVSAMDTQLCGIKAFRECKNVKLERCKIVSPEFGWSVRNITVTDCQAESEYFMMRSRNLVFRHVKFKGKYSFQYIKNGLFENCLLDTKDAFWHAENVTVRNCTVKGEYLAWYCKNVTFDHCRIIGTQPLCYCKGLRLIDCEMIDTDLSFEKSDVKATLTAPVDSIKNPAAGHITLPSVGELILDDPKAVCTITRTE